jgi:SAM-dependent methyltransferase
VSCCGSKAAYGKMFGARTARRDARRYRRDGPDATAAAIVRILGDVHGQTVLEVGGGVGGLHLELLKNGAARATNVELSPSYEEEARALAAEAGVAERVERVVADFADDGFKPADIVVLNRVLCCYPDPERLLGHAADLGRHELVFSFPRERWWIRAAFALANVWFRLRGDFRVFVHPAAVLLGIPAQRGWEPAVERQGPFWRIAGFRRHAPGTEGAVEHDEKIDEVAERFGDATEERRKQDRRIEDQPESGRLTDEPPEDEPDPRV